MTKNFKSYILSALAVAAIALSGCSKNDTGMNEIGKKDFSVTLTGASTKTTNEGVKTLWAANDGINLFHNVAGESTPNYINDSLFQASTAGATATFTGTLKSFDDTKTYNWYAIYPYTKQITTPANTSAGYVTVGSSAKGFQTQNGNNSTAHIAGKNYPVAGVASKIPGTETPVIQMKHLSALVAVKVENQTDAPITVSSVSMTADGVDIVGTYYIDFTQDPAVFTSSGATYVSNKAVLNVENGEEISPKNSATFYFAVKPFVVNEGDDLTITVSASNGPQEKVISATKNYEFTSGKVKTINFGYDLTVASYDFTTVAELNAIAAEVGNTGTEKFGKLTNAVVSFAPATNTAIITDGTGSITYYKSSGHGLKQGQTFTGDITVTVLNYNSLYSEVSSINATFEGEGAVVEPTTLTLAQLVGNYSTYQNEYCKVTELEVTAVSGKNVTVTDGTNTYVVYTNYGNATCSVGDKITAIGTVTKFGTTEEIKVWKADDLTITAHTPTEHAINFTQPEAGGSVKVTVGGTEITSGAKYIEGTEVKAEIVLTGGYNFTTWSITGAVNLSSTTSHVVTFKVGTSDINIVANLESSSVLTETFDLSTGYSNGQEVKTVTGTNATVTFDKGTNTNTPKYYTTGTAVRVYGGGYFTVSSTKKMSKIELTFGSGDGSNTITTDVVTYTNGTWEGSANSVTFTVGGTTGHRRIMGIKVTFE